MCNLSLIVEEKGRLIGLRQSTCALMESLPADVAMDMLKISSEDRVALKESLEKDVYATTRGTGP